MRDYFQHKLVAFLCKHVDVFNQNTVQTLFSLVLWHINHCRLFNAKSFLHIYIKHMISLHILLIRFLNEPELIFFGTKLNGFNYFYLIRIIQFPINHLFSHS